MKKFLLGLAAGVSLSVWLIWKVANNPIDFKGLLTTDNDFFDLIPEPEEQETITTHFMQTGFPTKILKDDSYLTESGPHLVYLVNDIGQIAWSFFSQEQWEMVNELVEVSGKDIWQVLQELVVDRLREGPQ